MYPKLQCLLEYFLKDTTHLLAHYLTKQRHVLPEEGYVEENCKVVEEGELREDRERESTVW